MVAGLYVWTQVMWQKRETESRSWSVNDCEGMEHAEGEFNGVVTWGGALTCTQGASNDAYWAATWGRVRGCDKNRTFRQSIGLRSPPMSPEMSTMVHSLWLCPSWWVRLLHRTQQQLGYFCRHQVVAIALFSTQDLTRGIFRVKMFKSTLHAELEVLFD